jgi:zinc/manganese transport system substrate-binding protein
MHASIRRFLALALAGLALVAAPSRAALNILACEPEWAALAVELGGERVKVSSATRAAQDPHRVQARPSLLAKARGADLLVCTGAELEIGWLPLLLRETGNPRIQPGRPGYFEVAAYVSLLEKPARLDRAEGDVHAQGNPHIQMDARVVGRVAAVLANRLGQLDPDGAVYYAARQAVFERRWNAALARWQRQAEPLRGLAVVSQHKAFAYLYAWLGVREVAVLEPKPGLEASAAHMAGVLNGLRAQPAKAVIRADYETPRASEFVAARAGIPALALPMSVAEPEGGVDALEAWFDRVVAALAGVPR